MPDSKVSLSPDVESIAFSKECRALSDGDLRIGEVYVFSENDPSCPSDGSLWGVFDKYEGGRIYLESSSDDMICFTHARELPASYRYCRLTTRSELRDYISALIYSERSSIL